MDDYSWIAPSVKNMADAFGLNPKVAAEGRKLQAEQEYLGARTRNTNADTALSPFRQSLLEAQAGANKAQAGKYTEDTKGVNITNEGRQRLIEAFRSGAMKMNPDGSVTIDPNSVNSIATGLAAIGDNPNIIMDAIRGLQGNASANPRARAQARGVAAAFGSEAAFSEDDQVRIANANANARLSEALAVQEAKNKGDEAVARIKAAGGDGSGTSKPQGQPGQPDQLDLNRAAEAVKIGAEWATKTPLVGGGYFDEGQALRVSQAARNAYPNLPIQDAIVKFISENKGLFREYDPWGWGNNTVDVRGNFPAVVVPSAASAMTAPVGPAAPSAAGSIGLTPQQLDAITNPAVQAFPPTEVPQIVPDVVRITADAAGKAVYDGLAPGTRFIDPNGITRVK